MPFDIQTYREKENIALGNFTSWRQSQKHNVDHFEKFGFPVRMDNMQQLRLLLDTMHEGRFERYMREMKGLTGKELQRFVSVLTGIVKFQVIHFPNKPVIIPFDSMMAAFVIYSKLNVLKKDFKSILEIGPGNGYLAFFLEKHQTLKNYSQVEACESFYLLQNYLDMFLFEEAFKQCAYDYEVPGIDVFDPELPGFTAKTMRNFKHLPVYPVPGIKKRCFQYPWWKIGTLAAQDKSFEIITSNANLLEFSQAALFEYLALIDQCLADDGIFFMHCTGSHTNGTPDYLWDVLHQFGFAPLFLGKGEVSMKDRCSVFTVLNGVFVNRRHGLHKKYYCRENFHLSFCSESSNVMRSFFYTDVGKEMVSKDTIAELVFHDLK